MFKSLKLLFNKKNKDIRGKVGFTLLGLLITIFGGIFQKLKIQINKPVVFAPEQFEDCFRDMISKALKKRNIINNTYTKAKDYVELGECSITNLNKLVIVIDNIDRCHNICKYVKNKRLK